MELSSVVLLIVGFMLGVAYTFHTIKTKFAKELELLNTGVNTSVIKKTFYKLEQVDGVVLVYNQNNNFITQGKDVQEIAIRLKEKHVDSAVLVEKINNKQIIYLLDEGKLTVQKIMIGY